VGLRLDDTFPSLLFCQTVHKGTVNTVYKKIIIAGHLWFTPVILATPEAEIRRIWVQGQRGQIICKTPISKIPNTKKD
jgi:hypothetical protein